VEEDASDMGGMGGREHWWPFSRVMLDDKAH